MPTTITQIIFGSAKKIKRISSFRGAIISSIGRDNTLFHNHNGESVIYAYPLIQYKQIKDNPIILGINEGAKEISEIWSIGDRIELNIDKEYYPLLVSKVESFFYAPEISCVASQTYIIRNWLPFNQTNYQKYKSLKDIHEKINLLSKLMIGNILSLLKGLGYWIDDTIIVEIVEVLRSSTIKYKGVELVSFDIKINTNITLPHHCGIGKGSSKGYGIISDQL